MTLVRSLTELDEKLGVVLRSKSNAGQNILRWVIRMDPRQAVAVCRREEFIDWFNRDLFNGVYDSLKGAWVYGLENCNLGYSGLYKQDIRLVDDGAGGRFCSMDVRVFEPAESWFGYDYIKAVIRYRTDLNNEFYRYVIVWQDSALQTTYTPVYAAPDPV